MRISLLAVWIAVLGAGVALAGEPVELMGLVPENTLLFAGRTAGPQTAKAQAGTALGAIAVEPQVARFCETFWAASTGLARKEAKRNAAGAAVDAGLRVLAAVWGGQTGIALIDAGAGDKGFFVQAALLSRVDGDAKAFDADVLTLLKAAGAGEAKEIDVAGRRMRTVKSPVPGGVYFGMVDGVFVAAASREAVEAIVARIDGRETSSLATSPPLLESRKRIGGDAATRIASVHVNMTGVRLLVDSMPMLKFSPVGAVMGAIGADRLEGITWEMHARGRGYYNAMYALYAASTSQPASWDEPALSREALGVIPRDAWWAAAFQVDFAGALDRIIAIVKAADGSAAKEARRGLKRLDKLLGMSLRDDILKLLGPTVVAYDSVENGGVIFTGTTLVAESPDAKRLCENLDALARSLGKIEGGFPRVNVRHEAYRGADVRFTDFGSFESDEGESGRVRRAEPVPVAPAWAARGKYVVIALYPQMVRTAIDRMIDAKPERDSILANEDVIAAGKILGPIGTSFVYGDTKTAMEQLYPFLTLMAPVGASLMRTEGMKIDASAWPSQSVVMRHLFADVRTSRSDDRGVLSVSYGPLPVGASMLGGGITAPAMMASILLPSLSRARELSKRTVCMANLRAIGQGMHIYAQNHDEKFPPDFKALVDAQMIAPKQFWCPGCDGPPGELDACYVYVEGQGPNSNSQNVLAYEKPAHHQGEGANVLFVDGHVEFVRPESRVAELVEETRERMHRGSKAGDRGADE